MKIVPVKFSDAHERNTKWNLQTARETRGIEHKSPTRVSLHPSSNRTVTTPRVTTKEKLNSGMMVVTR